MTEFDCYFNCNVATMFTSMTDQIRKVVKIELLKQDIRQTDLADELEVSRQYLSQLLTGKTGELNPTWFKIFSRLGLKLIIVSEEENSNR